MTSSSLPCPCGAARYGGGSDTFLQYYSLIPLQCIETKLDPDEKPLAVQAKFPSSPTFASTASNTALNFFALRLRALDDSVCFSAVHAGLAIKII
jgi:hypothetical protein